MIQLSKTNQTCHDKFLDNANRVNTVYNVKLRHNHNCTIARRGLIWVISDRDIKTQN